MNPNYEPNYPNFENRNIIEPSRDVQNKSPMEVPEQIVVPPKKNRTLQFYKFLFYSMKMEIKVHEFYDLVRFSNQSEISLWILAVVLYFNSPPEFSNIFVWIHLIHVIRGLIGFLILLKLPRSYTVVEAMKNVPERDLETKLFNDIARDVLKKTVIEKLEGFKSWLIVYFVLTSVNFVFDVIDFLYILGNIDAEGTPNNKKVIFLAYLVVAFLYLAIDLAYFFWTNSLVYTFPPSYLEPINNAFSGMYERLKMRFRIGKKPTDIRQEAVVMNAPDNQSKDALSNNVSNDVNPHHIEIEMDMAHKRENFNSGEVPYNYPSKNFKVEKYLDQKVKNEEMLD